MLLSDYLDTNCVIYTGVAPEAPVLAYLPSTCTQVFYGVQHQTFQGTSISPPTLVNTQPQPLAPLTTLSPNLAAEATTPPVVPTMKLVVSQNATNLLAQVGVSPLRRAGFKRRLEGSSAGVFVARDGSIKPLHCAVCQVTLNAPAQARQHYEGKNHARKVKMSQDDGDSSSESSESIKLIEPVEGSRRSRTSSTPTKVDPEVYCTVCCMSFNSSKQSRQHYQGKNHSKRLHRSQRQQRRAQLRHSSSMSSIFSPASLARTNKSAAEVHHSDRSKGFPLMVAKTGEKLHMNLSDSDRVAKQISQLSYQKASVAKFSVKTVQNYGINFVSSTYR